MLVDTQILLNFNFLFNVQNYMGRPQEARAPIPFLFEKLYFIYYFTIIFTLIRKLVVAH